MRVGSGCFQPEGDDLLKDFLFEVCEWQRLVQVTLGQFFCNKGDRETNVFK